MKISTEFESEDRTMRRFNLLPMVLLVAACGGSQQVSPNLPRGAAAYNLIPSAGANPAATADYRIGPYDSVDIGVFGEPDLSRKGQQVESTGLLTLPLVGTIPAAGKTASQLGHDVERLFAQKYL